MRFDGFGQFENGNWQKLIGKKYLPLHTQTYTTMKRFFCLLILGCLLESLTNAFAQSVTSDLAAFELHGPVKYLTRYAEGFVIDAQFDKQGNLLNCSIDDQVCSIMRPRQGELYLKAMNGEEIHFYVNMASMLLETSEFLRDGIFSTRRYLFNAEKVLMSYEEEQEQGGSGTRVSKGRVFNVLYPSAYDSNGNWTERRTGEYLEKQVILYHKLSKK